MLVKIRWVKQTDPTDFISQRVEGDLFCC